VSLGASLSLVIAAFVALMTTVLVLAFRERKLARAGTADAQAQGASDARVLVTIFGSIIGGMLLMVVTAVLVFVQR